MIDRATVDRILDAVRIEEVVGDFVSLKRHGTNYVGLCPFHADKNPSLSVSATKGIFKCFSCGESGTAVSFVMKHEHMTYPEALRYLAAKYHIEIEEKEESPEEIAKRMRYDSLLVVSEYAQKFYQDVLWNTDPGRAIGLSYFHERKFTDETIKKFGLGYAADRSHSLSVDAIKKGYKKEFLVDTGLSIERDNGELADRFYDRVMFPIYSISGRVIAFGGRTLRTDKTVAKYVNSPQSEIYDKSRSLYGLFQAKGAIAKADRCILVEGYADVISMHQSGIENVVASSGTSLTVEQIRLIKRFTNNIILMYDGDAAGVKAALRGTDLILEQGLSVKVVLLPPEDDPDSYAKAHTFDEINDYISAHAADFISFKCEVLEKDMEADPIQRAGLISDIIRSVSVIPDQIQRSVYAEALASRFEMKVDTILSRILEMRETKKAQDRLLQRSEYNRSRGYERQAGGFLTGNGSEAPPPSDEPVFDSQDVYPVEDLSGVAPVRDAGYVITNKGLAANEREILTYLYKYGNEMMKFEARVGEESREPVRVDEFIRDSLSYDD
ncbi:MAG: DNA primase, partial [Bacteroidales bacterium]|nr:DNA primase [Bacteroidales bacterium]